MSWNWKRRNIVFQLLTQEIYTTTILDTFGEKNSCSDLRGCTALAGVVDEDDFVEEVTWRAVDDAVNGAQECRPRLVVEDDDDAGVRVRAHVRVLFALAPVNQTHRDAQSINNLSIKTHNNTCN